MSLAPKRSCCALGRRGDIAGINAALRAGLTVGDVAHTYGLSRATMGQHARDCLKLDPSAKPSKPSELPEDFDAAEAVAVARVAEGEEPDEDCPTCGRRSASSLSAESASTKTEREAKLRRDEARAEREAKLSEAAALEREKATRARLPIEPKDARGFDEQALVCADLVASGAWKGRETVRYLSRMWGVSREGVNERHRTGAIVAKADRGAIEAERQVAIGALQEQERMALEAFETSKYLEGDENSDDPPKLGAGDPRLLALATNARKEIARIAGCVPQSVPVQVNITQSVEFTTAATGFVAKVEAAFDAVDELAQRMAAKLGYPVPRAMAASACEELQAMLDERIAAPQLPASVD